MKTLAVVLGVDLLIIASYAYFWYVKSVTHVHAIALVKSDV